MVVASCTLRLSMLITGKVHTRRSVVILGGKTEGVSVDGRESTTDCRVLKG